MAVGMAVEMAAAALEIGAVNSFNVLMNGD
jgi:hypothetical protein